MFLPSLTPESIASVIAAVAGGGAIGGWLVKREENRGQSTRRHADELSEVRKELRGEIAQLRVQVSAQADQISQLHAELHVVQLSYAVFREKVRVLIQLFRAGHEDWKVLAEDIESDEHHVDSILDLPHASLPDRPRVKSPGKDILVVEDDEATRDFLKYLLRSAHYNVTTTHSALEALKLVERGSDFDLVLTDLAMPGMSGDDLLKILPNIGSENAKLVIYTGADENLIEQAESEGLTAWRKPLTSDEILRRVREVLA